MKIAIIGGGASGLACAIEIKKLNMNNSVTVYERNPRVGKKILATGNGRCNLTNLNITPENYRNFGFASFALNEFSPTSNISFFESIGLFTKADAAGRVYPMSNKAESVLDCLRNACSVYGVNTVTDSFIDKVKHAKDKFIVSDKAYDILVVSCGGKSAPSQGTDGSGYKLLSQLGHKITSLSPSLVQLVTSGSNYPKQLKGIRCEVDMTFTEEKIKKHGELLFASYGLSGIVSMELSAYISPYLNKNKNLTCCARQNLDRFKKATVKIDFVPNLNENDLFNKIKALSVQLKKLSFENVLSGFMPSKIGRTVLNEAKIDPQIQIGNASDKAIEKAVFTAKNFIFTVSGVQDFSFSQVTSGGADISEFDGKTMQSKKVENLYCIGEILDVDGDCGGYNLNWAWSSARLAARAISEKGDRNVTSE